MNRIPYPQKDQDGQDGQDVRMNRIPYPQKERPNIKNAGAYSLQFDCRDQLLQVVIPLPELPGPVDTRIPPRIR